MDEEDWGIQKKTQDIWTLSCYSKIFLFRWMMVVWVGWKYIVLVYFLNVNYINRVKKINNEIKQEIIGGVSGLQIIPPTRWSWPYRIKSPMFNGAKSSHKWTQRTNHRNWILNQYMLGISKGCFQCHLRKFQHVNINLKCPRVQ